MLLDVMHSSFLCLCSPERIQTSVTSAVKKTPAQLSYTKNKPLIRLANVPYDYNCNTLWQPRGVGKGGGDRANGRDLDGRTRGKQTESSCPPIAGGHEAFP